MHTEQEQRDVPLRKEDERIFWRIEEAQAEISILRNAVIRPGSLKQSVNSEVPLTKEDIAEGVQVHTTGVRTSTNRRAECEYPHAFEPREDIAEVVQGLPPERDAKTNRGAESEYTEIENEKRRSTCTDQRGAR